jgi:hypothetical protein
MARILSMQMMLPEMVPTAVTAPPCTMGLEKCHGLAAGEMPHKCSPNKSIKSSVLSSFIGTFYVHLNKWP